MPQKRHPKGTLGGKGGRFASSANPEQAVSNSNLSLGRRAQSPREKAVRLTDVASKAIMDYATTKRDVLETKRIEKIKKNIKPLDDVGDTGTFKTLVRALKPRVTTLDDIFSDWMHAYCDWQEICDDEAAIYQLIVDDQKLRKEATLAWKHMSFGKHEAIQRLNRVMSQPFKVLAERDIVTIGSDGYELNGDIELVDGKIVKVKNTTGS